MCNDAIVGSGMRVLLLFFKFLQVAYFLKHIIKKRRIRAGEGGGGNMERIH